MRSARKTAHPMTRSVGISLALLPTPSPRFHGASIRPRQTGWHRFGPAPGSVSPLLLCPPRPAAAADTAEFLAALGVARPASACAGGSRPRALRRAAGGRPARAPGSMECASRPRGRSGPAGAPAPCDGPSAVVYGAIGGSRKAVSDAAGAYSPNSFSKFPHIFGFRFLLRCCAILNPLFLIKCSKFSLCARKTANFHEVSTHLPLIPPGSAAGYGAM